MSEIMEAIQVINMTWQIGSHIVEFPIKLIDGQMSIVQKAANLLDMGRRHKADKGETAMDDIFREYGNAVTFFDVDETVKGKLYEEFDKKGVKYSYMPPTEEGRCTVIVPIQQNRTVTEILTGMEVEYVQHATLGDYTASVQEEVYKKHKEQNDQERAKEKEQEQKAGKKPNFFEREQSEGGAVLDAALMAEVKRLQSDPNAQRIRITKDDILKEQDGIITIRVPDTSYTVDISKQGVYGNGAHLDAYIMKDKLYVLKDSVTGRLVKDVNGEELFTSYYNLSTEQKHEKYLQRMTEQIEQQVQEPEKPAQLQKESKSLDVEYAKNYIVLKEKQVLAEDPERGYLIKLPYHVHDHDTGEQISAAYGGQTVWISYMEYKTSAGVASVPEPEYIPEKVIGENEKGEKIIAMYIPPQSAYKVVSRNGEEKTISGKELYKNFNAVPKKQMTLLFGESKRQKPEQKVPVPAFMENKMKTKPIERKMKKY